MISEKRKKIIKWFIVLKTTKKQNKKKRNWTNEEKAKWIADDHRNRYDMRTSIYSIELYKTRRLCASNISNYSASSFFLAFKSKVEYFHSHRCFKRFCRSKIQLNRFQLPNQLMCNFIFQIKRWYWEEIRCLPCIGFVLKFIGNSGGKIFTAKFHQNNICNDERSITISPFKLSFISFFSLSSKQHSFPVDFSRMV